VFAAMAWVGAEILRTRAQVGDLTKTVDAQILKSTLMSAAQEAEELELKRTLQQHMAERRSP